MQWGKIFEVLKKNPASYAIFLLGNIGGLLIAYLAIFTVVVLGGGKTNYYPGIHEYLIVGAISVTVSGASYITLRRETSVDLNLGLQLIWVGLLVFVYGDLVNLSGQAAIPSQLSAWIVAIFLSVICLLWSSITWLHEQGIRSDRANLRHPSGTPPKALTDAARNLPKISKPAKKSQGKTGDA